MSEYVLRAEVDGPTIWTPEGEPVDPRALPLSSRLLEALDDWAAFLDDVGGEISDHDVMDAFVSQGFRIAHAMRRELKGRTVWLQRLDTDERVLIENRTPR
ncbi:MAG: hypothetical protein ACR2P0_20975 [Acidimicrobiales bacterium]